MWEGGTSVSGNDGPQAAQNSGHKGSKCHECYKCQAHCLEISLVTG